MIIWCHSHVTYKIKYEIDGHFHALRTTNIHTILKNYYKRGFFIPCLHCTFTIISWYSISIYFRIIFSFMYEMANRRMYSICERVRNQIYVELLSKRMGSMFRRVNLHKIYFKYTKLEMKISTPIIKYNIVDFINCLIDWKWWFLNACFVISSVNKYYCHYISDVCCKFNIDQLVFLFRSIQF